MTKKKTETAVTTYQVLIDCHNDKRRFVVGDTVTTADFPQTVIDNWLALDPPVLKAVN